MKRAILAIDIGSSSVRASLYDTGANPVPGAEAKVESSFATTPDGGATISPDVLLESVTRAIDSVVKSSDGYEIVGVCASAFWHSLLGVDGNGEPTTEIITWADRRAASAAAHLRESLDAEAIHRRTGCVPHSSYWPAKLLWLREERRDVFEGTERWISPSDFVYERLFGRTCVGTSMASGTGLFDQNEQIWDTRLLDEIGLDESRLSGISDEPLRELTGEYAGRWPALREVPWFPAVGDGACANVGSGCTGRDRLALTIGTSGAMRVLWEAERAEAPEGLWLYRADTKRFVSGGALSDGGNLVAWLKRTLRLPDDVERRIAGMEPDSHGLTFLPLLAGERGPGWSDMASGAISGLSMSTEPAQILRAAMEATALRFALISRRLETAFPEEKKAVASGGALLASTSWAGIVADALGVPVEIPSVEEASSRGAALLALESLGYLEIEEAAPTEPVRVIEPDAARHETYMAALERQVALYEKIAPE